MNFHIPQSAIEENQFTIQREGNLFVLLMLWINMKSWKSTFQPIESIDYSQYESVQSEDAHYFWTQVSGDGIYFEPGVTDYKNSSLRTTRGFVKMKNSWTENSWNPIWNPFDYYLDEEIVTVEIADSVPQKSVFVGCELCSFDQRINGECNHWSDGAYGSWVSVDFELENKAEVEAFITHVAQQTNLGELSKSAEALVGSGFSIPNSYFQK